MIAFHQELATQSDQNLAAWYSSCVFAPSDERPRYPAYIRDEILQQNGLFWSFPYICIELVLVKS
jgi:hypothetical protein